MSKFICSSCGSITENNLKGISIDDELKCSCGNTLETKDLYPSMNALNFISTANELYEDCKSTDKQNKNKISKLLDKEYDINISLNDLTNFISIYEKNLGQYEDNNLDVLPEILDKYEEDLIKIEYEYAYNLANILPIFWKNRTRKPFVIIVASAIEMLFNDFFVEILKYKLGEKGCAVITEKYKYSGIQECINICDAFIDIPLKDQIESIKPGFFDKWTSLRNDRNSITHSNNKYITMKRTNDIAKLISESEEVFLNLKKNIYTMHK